VTRLGLIAGVLGPSTER